MFYRGLPLRVCLSPRSTVDVRLLNRRLITNVERMWRKRNLKSLLVVVQINTAMMEISLEISQNLKIQTSKWPRYFSPEHMAESSIAYHRAICIHMFVAASKNKMLFRPKEKLNHKICKKIDDLRMYNVKLRSLDLRKKKPHMFSYVNI